MLALRHRFHGHNGVRRVYKLGRPTRTTLMSMHLLRNEKVRRTKTAVVVSRKVDKSAVKRNRIRRRIYELVRAEVPNITTPTEIVITVYSVDIATMPAKELQAATTELFRKAKL
ncbi:MAG: ribonuclease P protein component [bacterium]|nr:ribonuclease P protein component [bacterium]